MEEENQKCMKLVVENRSIFGIVKVETPDYFVFATGSGKLYTVSKKSDFLLLPTNKLFEKRW